MLWHLLRGAPRDGSHAQRLAAVLRPAGRRATTRFRERLLHGRRELIERLPAGAGDRVVELGGGTGRNLEFFGARLAGFASFEVVDLCPRPAAVARRRSSCANGTANVAADAGDATDYQPAAAVDCVYLLLRPDHDPGLARARWTTRWPCSNPGGTLGVVDFHLPRRQAGEPLLARVVRRTTACGCRRASASCASASGTQVLATSGAARCPICRDCGCPVTCSSGRKR